MQNCILCGQSVDTTNIRPGNPVICADHGIVLAPRQAPTPEQAREAAHIRVGTLSAIERRAQGLCALEHAQRWSESEQRVRLPEFYEPMIEAQKAYLEAFHV